MGEAGKLAGRIIEQTNKDGKFQKVAIPFFRLIIVKYTGQKVYTWQGDVKLTRYNFSRQVAEMNMSAVEQF